MLEFAKKLKQLLFGVTQCEKALDTDYTERLLDITWPALTSFELRIVELDPDSLLDFFKRHKGTLTHLALQSVGSDEEASDTWDNTVKRCRQVLRLERAELDVSEWFTDEDGDSESLELQTDLAAALAAILVGEDGGPGDGQS